jgi:DNA polymerase-4
MKRTGAGRRSRRRNPRRIADPISLRLDGSRGRTVTLKVKFADFELISWSRTIAGAVGSRSELEFVSAELLKALFPMEKAVRLLGVSISVFEQVGDPERTSLAL